MNDLINCGERTIQEQGRIAIKEVLDANGLKKGDRVEVFLKKVEPYASATAKEKQGT